MPEKPIQEVYTLPDDPREATLFVSSYTKKGYRVISLTATHLVVEPPVLVSPSERADSKKTLLQD